MRSVLHRLLAVFAVLSLVVPVAFADETQQQTTTNEQSATTTTQQTDAQANAQQQQTSQVNINTADAQAIKEGLKISERKAEAIVAYREKNGSFKSVDDLLKVKGINKRILNKIRDKATVG